MATPYISYGLVCAHLENLWISQCQFLFGEVLAETRHSSYTNTLPFIAERTRNEEKPSFIFDFFLNFKKEKTENHITEFQILRWILTQMWN